MTEKKLKALSERQAQRCEEAVEHVCKCRCGGALHGAKRGSVRSLPLDDPHSPAKKCQSCNGKGERTYFDAPSGWSKSFKCEKCQGLGKVMPKEKRPNNPVSL